MGFPLTVLDQLKNTFTKKVKTDTLSILLTQSQEEGIPKKGFLIDASYGWPVTAKGKTHKPRNWLYNFLSFFFNSKYEVEKIQHTHNPNLEPSME